MYFVTILTLSSRSTSIVIYLTIYAYCESVWIMYTFWAKAYNIKTLAVNKINDVPQ